MKPILFFAYLDPGSGSLILQMVLGVIAAGFFTVKTYWKKIAGILRRKRDKTDSEHKV